ncbi:MAG: hypothetical protein RL748_1721, partial [Pseudomonadota bacterium]
RIQIIAGGLFALRIILGYQWGKPDCPTVALSRLPPLQELQASTDMTTVPLSMPKSTWLDQNTWQIRAHSNNFKQNFAKQLA